MYQWWGELGRDGAARMTLKSRPAIAASIAGTFLRKEGITIYCIRLACITSQHDMLVAKTGTDTVCRTIAFVV